MGEQRQRRTSSSGRLTRRSLRTVVVVEVVVDNVGCDSGVPVIFPGGGNDRYAIPFQRFPCLLLPAFVFPGRPRNARRISPCPAPPAGHPRCVAAGGEVAGVTDGAHPR